MFRKTAKSL